MALLYKNAKKEVEKEYNQLVKEGWTPVANEDGTTYSWKRGDEIYRGKLNPTPGRDAEAGFLKKHLTREARQDRLMSEKVTAMLPIKQKSSSTGASAGTSSTAKPEEKKPEAAKTDAAVVDDSGIMQPSEMRKFEPVTLPGLDLKPIPKRTPVAQEVKQPELKPLTRDIVPVYQKGKKDPTAPYIYIKPDDYQAIEPSGWKRFRGTKYLGKSTGDIGEERMGRIHPSLSMESGLTVGGAKLIDGEKHILIKNPDFIPRTFYAEDTSGVERARTEHGLIGRDKNRPVETIMVDGQKFLRVGKSGSDVAGNVASGLTYLLGPGSVKTASGPISMIEEAGTVQKAIGTGTKLLPASRETASVGKLMGGATKALTQGTPLELAPGATQLALPSASKSLIPGGSQLARNTWNAITNPNRFKLPPVKRLGPGFKSGGKLISK